MVGPTLRYSSQTSTKKLLIPSSFFPSCSSSSFTSTYQPTNHQYSTRRRVSEGSEGNVLPGVTNAETVHSLNLSTPFKYIPAPSLLITSSTTSKLAFAIICTTCLSCPPPTTFPPPPPVLLLPACWVEEEAPERAVRVPAKAEVDQVGRLEERGDEMD